MFSLNQMTEDDDFKKGSSISFNETFYLTGIHKKIEEIVPPNFSWLIPDVLAASARPILRQHLEYLKKEGIKVILSLHSPFSDKTLPPVYEEEDLTWHIATICDGIKFTMSEMFLIQRMMNHYMQKNMPVLVHCAWGRGRTGTVLACFFIIQKAMSSNESIELIRKLRPFSIETDGQFEMITEFSNAFQTLFNSNKELAMENPLFSTNTLVKQLDLTCHLSRSKLEGTLMCKQHKIIAKIHKSDKDDSEEETNDKVNSDNAKKKFNKPIKIKSKVSPNKKQRKKEKIIK